MKRTADWAQYKEMKPSKGGGFDMGNTSGVKERRHKEMMVKWRNMSFTSLSGGSWLTIILDLPG